MTAEIIRCAVAAVIGLALGIPTGRWYIKRRYR